ncbi:predicted protein [Sclerotinia sclerotiorum 1980 UF-70]|uniref:Uncharacterized protein n=1 Tax=Sclerotinia sclerotiorum (strain ATCC 18683 / 1980 / Ss-1) TaxID=665079 RepID=A7F0J6_SCLS1|nr:predicted protein [Sclerotinia sclerotiorum 1980 UF-70]EDN95238.1 predicted protein [Sclerotinia sclerotiorum 1980 UF-70]
MTSSILVKVEPRAPSVAFAGNGSLGEIPRVFSAILPM